MATFAHNAFGQRARKTETASSMSTVFAYALGGQLLAERRLRSDGTRELEREYLWLDSLPIAMAERSYAADGTTVTASQFVYLHADHLDTPRLATDAAQRIIWRWRSDAFGIGTADTDPDGDSIATEVALRFPGQSLDAETGLQYNYFRDYDPATGRYVESDPIGLEGGINTYAYASGNPIRNIDPTGEESIPLPRPIPFPGWAGPAGAVAGSGLAGWQIGSAIYPHIAEPLGDLIDRVCRDKGDDCWQKYTECLLTSLAGKPGSVWGQSRCGFCQEVCVRQGRWPTRAPTTKGSVRCDYWNYPGVRE